MECFALVHFELPVVADSDCIALERPRSGTFEIDAVFVITTAVTGAFEFLLPLKPVRRAAEMRANGSQSVNLSLPFVFVIDHPHAELGDVFRLDLPRREGIFEADFKTAWRFRQNIGEHKPRGAK